MQLARALSVLALAAAAPLWAQPASAESIGVDLAASSSSHNYNKRHGGMGSQHAARALDRAAGSAASPAHFERRITRESGDSEPVRRQKQNYEANNQATDFPSSAQQANWVGMAYDNPIGAAQDVLQNNAMVKNNDLYSAQYSINADQQTQLPWWAAVGLPFVPIGVAQAPGPNGGWTDLPPQPGFDFNDTWTMVEDAVMPFYISSNYDPQQIKRAIITWPGKPRDCWKYGAYALSALQAANYNATVLSGIPAESAPSNSSVLIISPMILNDQDVADGSVKSNYLAFHGSRWQSGYEAFFPKGLNRTLTSYDVMDNFTDWLFNRDYFPNLNSVTIMGHSMGGQATQRYALLKKTKPYDDNIRYWIGNPGSWAWLSEDRPNTNASCTTFDEWGYGLGGNVSQMTRYGRKQVTASKTDVVNRFLGRRVHIALALLDNGPGDTHCEALDQGETHLGRGSQFVQEVADVTGGTWPEKFSLSYVANTSHLDFNMFSANQSLWHIFQEDFDVRYKDLGTVSNPGDVPKKTPGVKAFATTTHKIMAYSLLLGSCALIVLAFACLPSIFPANTNSMEEAQWEHEAKRKLI